MLVPAMSITWSVTYPFMGEGRRRQAVLLLEVVRPGHQVDEVDGGMDAVQPPVQRRSVDQLHRQVFALLFDAKIINRDDVRMAQSRRHARLMPEQFAQPRIGRRILAQHL